MSFTFGTDLSGKVAVVTGAGGVLCSVFSKTLAEAGAKVALLSRSSGPIDALAEDINARGFTAKAYKCNVLDKERLEECRELILRDFGPCDILINGAGGNDPKTSTGMEYYSKEAVDEGLVSFFDLNEEGIKAVFELNFLGALLTTQVFAQDMVGRKGCSIINISSMNAYTPLTKIPAYSGAKAAVSNFTQWLAVHFSREGIRVNAIAPGFFSTKQNAALLWNGDGTPASGSPRSSTELSCSW